MMPEGKLGASPFCALRLAAVGALFVAAVAGMGADQKPANPLAPTPVQTVWPLPPEVARVRFVGVYGSSEDVGAVKTSRRVSLTETLLGKRAVSDEGRRPQALQKPFGVAADKYGRILVTDPALPGVVIIDPERRSFATLGQRERQATFRIPVGIATDEAGNVYVGDNALGQVFVFGSDLGYRAAIGAGEIASASGLAVDESGRRLYVADTKRHQLVLLDVATGKAVARIGRRGVGAGEFNYPTGVASGPDGRVYVTDTMNCRVQVFDAGLKWMASFGSLGVKPGQFRRPKGIAVDADNIVYVVDADFNNFQMFTPAGQPLMWVGEFGSRPGQMILPAGIAVERRRSRILVVEQVTRRVQVFERTTNGRP